MLQVDTLEVQYNPGTGQQLLYAVYPLKRPAKLCNVLIKAEDLLGSEHMHYTCYMLHATWKTPYTPPPPPAAGGV